jgi:hypothetical protein
MANLTAEATIWATMLDLHERVMQMKDELARKRTNDSAVRDSLLALSAWLHRFREGRFSLSMTVSELAHRQEATHLMLGVARSALAALSDSESD